MDLDRYAAVYRPRKQERVQFVDKSKEGIRLLAVSANASRMDGASIKFFPN